MDQLEVLYEDNHIIAINKRSSDIVQGDKTGDEPLSEKVKCYLKQKYNKPGEVFIGVVHRLDRPVSGVMLFAKTSKALSRLNEMFRSKEVQKTYWAVVKNRPLKEKDLLVDYLIKDEVKNKSRAYKEERKGALRCELEYQLIASIDRYHLLEVNPHTGRHHQIRVQLSSMGCAIKGDVKYGFERTNQGGSIHLHARKIAFLHPVKKEQVEIIAPVPDDVVWKAFEIKLKES
jgi:23S rRNA pseudouridine1911/1915/1917 synthase